MRWWITPTAVLALAVASGCEAPARYTALPMTPYDKDTAYRVDDSPSGFTLYVQQARYQFVLNDDILASCTQAIRSLAHEIGERRGHKIEFDNERVRMSFGRNGVNGISSCTAMVPVIWSDREVADGSPARSP
jgi:hypothetical protein